MTWTKSHRKSAAYWAGVEEAERRGAERMRKRSVGLPIPIPYGLDHTDDDKANGFRDGRDAYRTAIRALPIEEEWT